MRNQTVRVILCLIVAVFVTGVSAQTSAPARVDPDRSSPDISGKPSPQPIGSSPTATASVLQLIKFSGAVPDLQGVVGVTFALYADQEGGSPLWLETQNIQLDAEGRYTVLLGSTASEGLPLDIFASGEARWLSIQPQGQPEQARILLVAVPYALKAAEADRLAGRAASDYLLAEQLESQVRETVETQVADQLQTKSSTGGGDGTLAQVTGNGTAGQLPVFTSTGVDPTVGDSIMTQKGSNIGINATNPAVLLEMNSGGADLSPAMAFSTPNQQDFVSIFGGRLTNQNPFIAWRRGPLRFATADSLLGLNFSEKMRLTSSGNLGIGTTNPTQRLDVNGTVKATAFVGDGSGLSGIGGGSGWSLTGNSGTTPGTNFVGTTDNVALELKANGTRVLRLEPDVTGASGTSPNVLAGSSVNSIMAGVAGATISGGGTSVGGMINQVTDDFGTVGGGSQNRAGDADGLTGSALWATVAGGRNNTASGLEATVGGGGNHDATGDHSTVAGGISNDATGDNSTVGGGLINTASGSNAAVGGGTGNVASGGGATVPGGASNTAAGTSSLAAGLRAKAMHAGSFVWGDSTDADVASTGNDQFVIRANGGVRIVAGDLFLNANGPAGDSAIFFFNGGGPFNEIIFWDEGNDRFTITDDVQVVGTVTETSSRRYKTNIRTLPDALTKVNRLRGVSYDRLASGRHEIGLIAEEVAEVVPEVVSFDPQGQAEALDYSHLTALLVEALKEEHREIETLKTELATLKARRTTSPVEGASLSQ